MRSEASILHLDLDAFFASVEQRDKPSLAGKPVIVGGIGGRGVVATASYEARAFGVHSAMSATEARSRCPNAAFLAGRFEAYRVASGIVMDTLRELSPLVQPLSLDEAFVDLQASERWSPEGTADLVAELRAQVTERTEGLTCSVGVASSKLVAKIATGINKPDGVFIVAPGTEAALLAPMPANAIPGIGPATAERLRRIGIETIEQLRARDVDDLAATVGDTAAATLHAMAGGEDDRPVDPRRETKSVSVEDTFAQDIADPDQLSRIIDRMGRRVADRMRGHGQSGRTVTLKVRRPSFETHTRSLTLPHPTDDPRTIVSTAQSLLEATDLTGGLRLIGVGVSGLADWVQDDLFTEPLDEELPELAEEEPAEKSYRPGTDVHHETLGDGWVWGSGHGVVTVRFETRFTPPGPVRSFAVDDPALSIGHAGNVET